MTHVSKRTYSRWVPLDTPHSEHPGDEGKIQVPRYYLLGTSIFGYILATATPVFYRQEQIAAT